MFLGKNIQARWIKWLNALGVIYDKNVLLKFKEKNIKNKLAGLAFLVDKILDEWIIKFISDSK